MRPPLGLTLVPLLAGAALAGSIAIAASSPVSGADFAEIRATGAIRVLAATDENPEWFSSHASPRPGFEREVLEGFARLHKLRFEFVRIDHWDQAIPMLVQNKGDILAGVNVTEARRKLIDFTGELLPARHVAVSRKPRPPIASEAEFRAQSVAVVPDTTWAEAVARAGVASSQIVAVADVPEALAALKSGRATVAVVDILDFLQAHRKDPDLELGVTLGAALSSAWGVRKSDPELRRALDAYLADFRRSAGWSRILVEYFGSDAPAALGRSTTN
jgi:ABC-type amino acid transport substrate-binding protein